MTQQLDIAGLDFVSRSVTNSCPATQLHIDLILSKKICIEGLDSVGAVTQLISELILLIKAHSPIKTDAGSSEDDVISTCEATKTHGRVYTVDRALWPSMYLLLWESR